MQTQGCGRSPDKGMNYDLSASCWFNRVYNWFMVWHVHCYAAVCKQGKGKTMKVTIEVPDTTKVIIYSYGYIDKNNHDTIGRKVLLSQDLEEFKNVDRDM